MRCVEAESRDQRHLGLVKWRGLICNPEEDHQEGYEREGTTVEMSDRGVSLSSKSTDYAVQTARRAARRWVFHHTNGMTSLKSSEMFVAHPEPRDQDGGLERRRQGATKK